MFRHIRRVVPVQLSHTTVVVVYILLLADGVGFRSTEVYYEVGEEIILTGGNIESTVGVTHTIHLDSSTFSTTVH